MQPVPACCIFPRGALGAVVSEPGYRRGTPFVGAVPLISSLPAPLRYPLARLEQLHARMVLRAPACRPGCRPLRSLFRLIVVLSCLFAEHPAPCKSRRIFRSLPDRGAARAPGVIDKELREHLGVRCPLQTYYYYRVRGTRQASPLTSHSPTCQSPGGDNHGHLLRLSYNAKISDGERRPRGSGTSGVGAAAEPADTARTALLSPLARIWRASGAHRTRMIDIIQSSEAALAFIRRLADACDLRCAP